MILLIKGLLLSLWEVDMDSSRLLFASAVAETFSVGKMLRILNRSIPVKPLVNSKNLPFLVL